MANGKQTRRKSRQAVRRRKYIVRRIMVLIIFLAVLAGLTLLLIRIFSGDIKPGGTAEASPTPGISPTFSPEPTPTPVQELPAGLDVSPASADMLSKIGFSAELMYNRDETETFTRAETITFGKDEDYTALRGITTYGGNNYRNTFTYGTQTVVNKTLTRVWDKSIGSLDLGEDGVWTGIGWTGMPVIVQWEEDVRPFLGVYDEFKTKDGFTEVIYPAMDGNIYFLELSTGKATRDPLSLDVAMKGTATLDPRGYPLLYIGQGAMSTNEEGTRGAWFRVVSLIENEVIWSFGGRDPFSPREWQAYDSSAMVDAETDTLIAAGENGVLYSVKLNSTFDRINGTVSVSPDPLAKYRYTANGYADSDESRQWGIESSPAFWKNYAFFTDNGGYLQCVDLNSLKTMYAVDVTDDSDAGVVLEEDYEQGTLFLYTANAVSTQEGIENGFGKSCHRKMNALTGEIVWEKSWDAATGSSTTNGGTLATPHVGRGSISDLVIYNMAAVPVMVDGIAANGGRIIAYDKDSGEVVWTYEQAAGYWSAPVVIYDAQEQAYLIQCDREGMLRMHDARTGEVLAEVDLGSRIDATPAVFNNMLVVGTRGSGGSGESQKIIGVRIG